MNIPAKMLYGRMDEIVDLFSGDYPPELSNDDLRALATNMAVRIAGLEKQVVELRNLLNNHMGTEYAHHP